MIARKCRHASSCLARLVLASHGHFACFVSSMTMNLDDEDSVLSRVIQQDNCTVVAEMLESHLELLDVRNSLKRQSILHLAVSNASVQVVNYLCQSQLHNGSFINDQKSWGETALHVAVGMGDAKLVSMLCAVPNIDQSLKDHWKRTPVDLAIEMGHMHLIGEGLLSANNISLKDSTKESSTTLIPEAVQKKQHALAGELSQMLIMRKIKKPSSSANVIKVRGIFQDSQETVTGLVVTSNVSSKSPTVNSTELPHPAPPSQPAKAINKPLRVALSKQIEFPGDPDTIRSALLSKDKIDINGKDMFGLTALHKLAAWNKVDLMEILLADSDSDVNVVSPSVGGVLHSAVDMGALEAVSRLLTMPTLNLALTDKQGRTALELARERGLKDVAKLIQDRVV